jgi:[acyl-carrier-protein] S-malonyltransferase
LSNIGFIFPGQGSQVLGMGRDLYNKFSEAKAVFDEASEATGLDIAKLCFEGPADELNKTENTQPAILTASLAAHAVLRAMHVRPAYVAGHSLGELTAVAAAGGLTVGQAATLARERGRQMQEAVPEGDGLMAAVLGLDADKILDACRDASVLGVVSPANYNSPGQVVIAGEKAAVLKASKLCQDMGAKRVVPLAVSVPSHCMLMEPAAVRLKEYLGALDMKDLEVPLACNADGKFVMKAADVKGSLVRQLTMPLLWEDCVKALAREGCRVIIEVGPGKVLSGLVKRIVKDVEIRNVENETSLLTTLDYLSIGCKVSSGKSMS